MYFESLMKLSTLLLFVFLIAASFQPQRILVIKAGDQADGLMLRNSKVQDALEKYGENSGFSQGIACGDHDYHTNRYTFSKQGVTVISETIDNEDRKQSPITKIGITHPCNAVTEMGISFERDNIDKIIAVYGSPENSDSSSKYIEIHYTIKGISFKCDRVTKSIQKMEIYSTGRNPDFAY